MNKSFKGEVILYQTEDGLSRIQLREADGTVWLTQAEIAELFDNTKQNISLHIQNIFEEGELSRAATVKDSLIVQTHTLKSVNIPCFDLKEKYSTLASRLWFGRLCQKGASLRAGTDWSLTQLIGSSFTAR